MRGGIVSLIFYLLLFTGQLNAQNGGGQVQRGMAVLGIWSMHNISTGAIGWSHEDGSSKYFNQMNVLWNTVNFGLALSGVFSSGSEWGYEKSLKTEKLFLINAGLDLVYLGVGAGMLVRSNAVTKNSERLKGYGQSLLLQGGFLLVFDGAMFLILRNSRKNIAASGTRDGLTLNYTF